jgi:cation/acetate symporter
MVKTTVAAGNIGGLTLRLTLILFVSVVVTTMFAALITGPTRDEISEF